MNKVKLLNSEISIDQAFSLYIHFPFCTSKCPYCDFYSVKYEKKRVDQYWAALFKELNELSLCNKKNLLRTIYIGGGTPSLINADKIHELLKRINSLFRVSYGTEITLEANPNSLNKKKIIDFKLAGINRISLGIQSFNDKTLSFLGRKSSRDNNLKILKLINKYFDNYSIDLIFAVPGQSLDDFKEDIRTALEFSTPHISLYNLEIHKNTPLYSQLQAGSFSRVEDNTDAEMYEYSQEKLSNNNYINYEISNYAKKSFRAQHNYIYWKFKPYLALGAGASGFTGDFRYKNSADLDLYLHEYGSDNSFENTKNNDKKKANSFREFSKLSRQDKIAEFSFLALRTAEGLSFFEFKKRFNEDFRNIFADKIEKLKSEKLLIEKNGRIYLSSTGKLLANEVFLEFLPE